MDPRKTQDRKPDNDDDAPALEEQDWDAVESGDLTPDSLPENGDLRYPEEADGELPEEDDDNPYQNSDEALPDDREEAAISRDPTREDGLFDEI